MKGATTITHPVREVDQALFTKHGTVLLENILRDGQGSCSYLYREPVAVIQCVSSSMVRSCLDQIEESRRRGLHAAGFLAYGAGNAWTTGCRDTGSNGFPLLWFGLYEKVERFEGPMILPASDHAEESIEHSLDMGREEYEKAVGRVLDHIREGETYQVNYTARLLFRWRHDPWQLYLRLRRSQPVPYGAFLRCGHFSVVSLSPELFLQKSGDILTTQPMKGTAPRGADRQSDVQHMKWLGKDPKNRAENLMIVDLMRNDLGRLSVPGKVVVREPFRVRPYSSLFQMTTDVCCTMRSDVSLAELFQATFPPGSVTGAPKINTMRIISELETSPRKLYTGAIGSVDPEGNLSMNVAIRTIIHTASGVCEMGVGSGIVADSVPEDEFEEAALKGSFLNPAPPERVDLFETILLQEKGTLLWFEEHLARLENSASQLGYPFSRKRARSAVSHFLGKGTSGPAVLRLILSKNGDMNPEIHPLVPFDDGQRRILLSRIQTDPGDTLLRHKTTRRRLYDRELALAREKGFVETLFTNVYGCITEGAYTNLFVYGPSDRGGMVWKTPDVGCGLLPGIWRDKFMGSTGAVTTRIRPEELAAARSVVIGNSVRGAMEIEEIVDANGQTLYQRAGRFNATEVVPSSNLPAGRLL